VPTDPLAPLADLPGVREATARVRDAVDAVHMLPANRRGWPATAAEASIRAARASAALDGADPRLPTGEPAGSVTDPVLAGAVRVAESIGLLLETWQRAPLQVLARLHVLAAADLVGDDASGRPRADDASGRPRADDAFDRSQAADASGRPRAEDALGRPRADDEVSARLNMLARLVAGRPAVPGVVLTAVVHAELLAMTPFELANGVIARAAARLTAVSTGLDSKGLAVPEVGHLRRRDEYRTALAGYASGEPQGVAAWLLHCCEAWLVGAREAQSIAESLVTR
jgi:hypothetical protein